MTTGTPIRILDCTLRDGGYYNSWDFPPEVVERYLSSMQAAGVDVVELGLRSLINKDFKGASAYTTDKYLRSLNVPRGMKVAVMVNAVELLGDLGLEGALERLFPVPASASPVDVVRVACHVHEFARALPACTWLQERGYEVGFNLMQVADRSQEEVEALSADAAKYPLDVLYFADSMGSMDPEQTSTIIRWMRAHWKGALGIHTHDNMGLALRNTLRAVEDGATWLDATVTGMGRGPGNARTEELAIEIAALRGTQINLVPLLSVIGSYFQPLKNKCGWGSNPYYYLSGKYGIHPTYIQEMLGDSRYSVEDVLAVISHLKIDGGKKFSFNMLDSARHFYRGDASGSWAPSELIDGRDVLLLGAGPGVARHRAAIEEFIRSRKPIVMALNTQSAIAQELIDLRAACHPVRLLADCEAHADLPQPLVAPATMLPGDVFEALKGKNLLDFGMTVDANRFDFRETSATVPNSLVISYALAIATSGKARRIFLAGFDGYGPGDARTIEMERIMEAYRAASSTDVVSITPNAYGIPTASVYAMQDAQ